MKVARRRSRIRRRDLWTYTREFISLSMYKEGREKKNMTYICRVGFSLNDIENGDVAALLARVGANHPILWLKQSPHDVQHCRLADSLGLLNLITSKRSVTCHEEVTARNWNKRCYNAYEIIVHVAGIP